jgi:peptidyl-tRNA hydrolase
MTLKKFIIDHVKAINISFLIVVLIFIFYIRVIRPTTQWGDKLQAEWNKTGYDSSWLLNAQESINVIARSVEEYKVNYGIYPNNLSDIHDILISNWDYSYRVKQADGQTNGIPFYYKSIDTNKFLLLGVGKDGVYNTADDLLPQISPEQEKTTGLLKYVVKSFTYDEFDRERKLINMYKRANKIDRVFNRK